MSIEYSKEFTDINNGCKILEKRNVNVTITTPLNDFIEISDIPT